MKLIATTYQGLEEILTEELKKFNINKFEIKRRAVEFSGNLETLYNLNYNLRTAIRILLKIKRFYFKTAQDLYNEIYKIPWEKYFSIDKKFMINVVGSSTIFRHTNFPALKAKDAIVDRFRNKYKARPNVDKRNFHIVINLHFRQNYCTVSLDSSGIPLFKRGYRLSAIQAPLSEVLAAGLIQLSSWNTQKPLIDFMCGSGTIPIEAAMYAQKIPPQYMRKFFAFFHWNNYDENLWNEIKISSNKKIISSKNLILANDFSQKAVQITKKNLLNLQKNRLKINIEITQKDFSILNFLDKEYFLITNPPYDRRLKHNDIKQLYKKIGDTLKRNFKQGSEAWIFTANLEALKFIGLKIKKRIILYNGANEARFVKIPIY